MTAQGCLHCPDGHREPWSRSWGVFMASERDSDGQPTHIRVMPSNGAHVAESDAVWLRQLITDAENWRHHLRQRANGAAR